MQCISPIPASQDDAGNIVYSSAKASKGLIGFTFPCRRCLACRLNIAREKAVRCLHEAKMHEGNIFLTLTYSDEHLPSDKLYYPDWQNFIQALRQKVYCNAKTKEARNALYIPYMVTGEYGELNKRPHWHALLFNYYPRDARPKYTTHAEQTVHTSATIDSLWKKGNSEFGTVTIDSAGYVARYAAKKLVHGKDHEHDFHPIHKTSSRRAIGRSWIEKYYQHVFDHGFVVLPNGSLCKVPRYYLDWLKKYKPDQWEKYVTGKQQEIIDLATKKQRSEEIQFHSLAMNYKGGKNYPNKRRQVELLILDQKFQQLQKELKL